MSLIQLDLVYIKLIELFKFHLNRSSDKISHTPEDDKYTQKLEELHSSDPFENKVA